MSDFSFIRYERTLKLAFLQDESPEIENNYLGSIQIRPFNTKPIVQLTKFTSTSTIDLENYKVHLVPCNFWEPATISPESLDITAHVNITTFIENGITQFKIIYHSIPHDMHNALCYFEITLDLSENRKLYSNLFQITNDGVDLTTRIDYKDNTRVGIYGSLVQSIRVKLYQRNHVSATEIDAYYQITTEQNVNSRILETSLLEWYVPPINSWTFKRIEKAMYNGGFWLNSVRQYLTEPLSYESRESLSNVSEQSFITDPHPKVFGLSGGSPGFTPIEVDSTLNAVPMLASTVELASTSKRVSEVVRYIE